MEIYTDVVAYALRFTVYTLRLRVTGGYPIPLAGPVRGREYSVRCRTDDSTTSLQQRRVWVAALGSARVDRSPSGRPIRGCMHASEFDRPSSQLRPRTHPAATLTDFAASDYSTLDLFTNFYLPPTCCIRHSLLKVFFLFVSVRYTNQLPCQ